MTLQLNKIWFHGHSGNIKIKTLKKPSPSNPFFIAANVNYALQMASLQFDQEKENRTSTQMRRKNDEDLKNSQVLAIKIDASKVKVFDIKNDAKKLDNAYDGVFSQMLQTIATENGKHRVKMVNFDNIANIAKAVYENLKLDLYNNDVDASFQNIMHLARSGNLAKNTYLAFADEDDFEEYAKTQFNNVATSYGLKGYELFIKYMIAFMNRHGNLDEIDFRSCFFKDIVQLTGCNAIQYIDTIEDVNNIRIDSEAMILFNIDMIAGVKILSYDKALSIANK